MVWSSSDNHKRYVAPQIPTKQQKTSLSEATNRLRIPQQAEVLTGWWWSDRGLVEISDIEERFARGLEKFKIPYSFQVLLPTLYSLPGELKELDFVVGDTPVAIDGYIGHHQAEDVAKDIMKDALVFNTLAPYGYQPTVHIYWYELETQEQADLIVQERFA